MLPLIAAADFRVAYALLLVTVPIPSWGDRGTPAATPPGVIENLREAAPGVWVGGSPTNADAWATLARLGVKTIVGVDSLPPNVDAASRHGIRVVHVPLGYDGIEDDAAAQLTRVADVAERPLFVYCHHGRHRGPAAAAIVCRAAGLLDADGAERLLVEAGTSRDYAGLWQDVATYQRPSGTPAAPLRETAEVSALRIEMGRLDRAWDAAETAGDESARRAALLLAAEALRESERAAAASGADESLLARFAEARVALAATRRSDRAGVDAFNATCVRCHAEHRDR